MCADFEVILADGQNQTGVDKNVIRQFVGTNIDLVRTCYNAGLKSDHKLAGRVEIQFAIAAGGGVMTSVVLSSDLPGELGDGVASCIADAVRELVFPTTPHGGMVRVAYPFTLSPG